MADPKLTKQYAELTGELQARAFEKIGTNTLRYLATVENLNYMRGQLLLEGDSPVEQLIVDHILTQYLYSGLTDLELKGLDTTTAFINEAKHQERQFSKANKRLLRAFALLTSTRKALSTLRKNEQRKLDNRKRSIGKTKMDIVNS